MKNRHLFIFMVIFSLVLITGCEDFLDKAVEGQVPLGQIDYTDESRMYEPVSGVYAAANANNLHHWANHCMMLFRSDFIFKGAHAGDQPVMEDIQDFKYESLTNAWFVNNLWTAHFGLIRDADAALEELDLFAQHASDQDLVNQYKAEVRFLRALAYWRMARIYGDIPWYNKDIVAGALRKAPREEAYQYIINELQEIVNHLPSQHPAMLPNKGGVTRWAAYALLAKAAADVQEYQIMHDAAKAVVDSGIFSLYPDYYNLFKKPGEFSVENIFELNHTDFSQSTGNTTFMDQYYVAHGIKQQGGTRFDGEDFNGGWGFSMPAQKFIDLMEERGETVRLTTNIIYPNTRTQEGDSIGSIPADLQALLDRYNSEGRGAAEAYFFKTYLPFNQQTQGRYRYGGFNNVRLFRYADVLLLYAEALVHLNGPGAGDAYINQVRDRANMPDISGATIDDILDERAVELEFEWAADRFFDLIRLDRTEELGPNFQKGVHEFYPIPTVQIDLQPGLAEPPVSGLFPN
ncbi:MAG: RagB/SusD family nutrient uptake outer membrane protein [Bacteroidota bacterium]